VEEKGCKVRVSVQGGVAVWGVLWSLVVPFSVFQLRCRQMYDTGRIDLSRVFLIPVSLPLIQECMQRLEFGIEPRFAKVRVPDKN
jgi:hypothetical protein